MGEPHDGLPRLRAGDVLAGRYLVADLLGESRGGRFWRAEDQVLARHVALHVIAADDERADGLLEAARLSATVHDRRILRVLDADRVDGLCFVVNEWGAGSSLDIMLARDGPLPPRRAAYLVAETAAVVAAAHDIGVAHGRLAPENLLVDHHGAVRIIGLAVEAALWGLPSGRQSSDVTDLAALLYAGLTGRWCGVSRSAVPAAHQVGGRVLRPRKVRAGVPRVLDDLCDEVLNGVATGTHAKTPYDLSTAHGIADALAAFVGDPTGLTIPETDRTLAVPVILPDGPVPVAAPVEEPITEPTTQPATQPIAEPDAEPDEQAGGPTQEPAEEPAEEPEGAAEPDGDAELDAEPDPEPDPQPDPEPEAEQATKQAPVGTDAREPLTGTSTPGAPPEATDLPTQAGMPVFDDERDEVAWISARAEKPPPPPPFEETPERPLFAPDPPTGRPARTPRPGVTPASGDEFWPWDSGRSSTGSNPGVTTTGSGIGFYDDEDDGVPGRSWLRLAAVVAACMLLLVAVVVAFNLGQGRSPLEFDEEPPADESTPSASANPTRAEVVADTTATDLDPQGSPPEENPDLAPNVVDGDAETTWRTSTYSQQFGPGGLKTGVGVVVDLGEVRDVRNVEITFVGQPTDVRLYVTDETPTGVAGLQPVASETADGTSLEVDVEASGQYVVVWLTSLPTVQGGFRGQISEVVVRA